MIAGCEGTLFEYYVTERWQRVQDCIAWSRHLFNGILIAVDDSLKVRPSGGK